MKVGPDEADVPTLTVDTSTVSTVPAIFVFATFAIHCPVSVEFDGVGAKHDWLLLAAIDDAKAPDERSCKICNPAEDPVNSDIFICTPVMSTGPSNKKS